MRKKPGRLGVVFLVITALAASPLLWGQISLAQSRSWVAPRSELARPIFQAGNESEPNDTLADADPIAIAEVLTGQIPFSDPNDVDFFELSTEIGRQYEVTLNETPASADYQLNIQLLDSNGDFVEEDDTGLSSGEAVLDWTASQTIYYFRISGVTIDDDADYGISVKRLSTTPTSTPTPGGTLWDECEMNDTLDGTWTGGPPGGPCPISVGERKSYLNFVRYGGYEPPDIDTFSVWSPGGPGHRFRLTTEVEPGVYTDVTIYDPSGAEITGLTDLDAGSGSIIEWSTAVEGIYKIKIENREPLPHDSDETYDLIITDISPTPTPTLTSTPTPGPVTGTPTPTPIRGADRFEPNYDFEHATLIGLDVVYDNLNFVPWGGFGEDNDFFRLWVRSGVLYTCETFDLAPATNTNMIFYSAPSFDAGFAGNNDVIPFDPNDPYRSRITFFSTFDGYLYILLGQVGEITPEEGQDLSYKLNCRISMPGTATATPTLPPSPTPRPSDTPWPSSTPAPGETPRPTDTPWPTLTPTPTPQRLTIRPLTTPTPPPAMASPTPTPAPGLYTVELLLYYDQNEDGQPGAGEGIAAVSAQIYDVVTGELLAQGYTDDTGYLRFTVSSARGMRLSVPFFEFNQVIAAADTRIQVRVLPRP